ncbi:M4 family metallopeptidase [Bordetella sp. 2513F-2]
MSAPRTLIPPYLLDHLASRRGHAAARAAYTLQLEQRRALAATAPAAPLPDPGHTPGRPTRQVHDAANGTDLPGELVRSEGQGPRGDPAVDEAYAHLGAVHAYFWTVHGRDSIDGAGMPLVATVHYGEDYENAFWNGAQMVFGDGDGGIFNRFTVAVDIVGHELAHGVIDRAGGLHYQGQSGALNESLCDVFGSLVKQHAAGQRVDEADWLVGQGLFTDAVNARALRSMAQPGTAYDDPALGRDPQPAHMRDFVVTAQDNGGVHINSGIPNRAFYLAASALGGHAWEHAGRLWYGALTGGRLRPDMDFAEFAGLTLAAASEAELRDAARRAWQEVGVLA